MSIRCRIPQPRVGELLADPDAVLREVSQREDERLGLEPGLEDVAFNEIQLGDHDEGAKEGEGVRHPL
jgi:hypothetical protein